MTPRARILVADDHAVVREGLRQILAAQPDLMVAAEAADGESALALALGGGVDLLLLDISLPGRSGTEVLRALREAGSRLPVLFFSMHPAAQYAAYLQRAGAQGFVGKDAPGDELPAALRQVLAGATWFSPTAAAASLAILSAREAEVLQGLRRGEPLIDIAARLGISNKSVGTYRRRILEKLGVAGNAELIALVTRLER